MKRKTKILLLILILLLAGALCAGVIIKQRNADQEVIEGAGTAEHAELEATSLSFGEEEAPLKKHISALLLIGTDTMEEKEEKDTSPFPMTNNALADFMVILVFDEDAKTVTPLQINRDTICEVPWLGMNGKVAGYETEQITYAHMYGKGAEDSAYNCVRAVKRFLYQAPIDNYLAFTMDAVPILNDMVGGVTVTLTEDLPALGEEYTAGAEITLKGQAALRFVRYRDTSVTESNLPRMQRHRLYLDAFIPQAKLAVAENQNFVTDAWQALEPYLCTDLTVTDMSNCVEKLSSYEILPAITYSGTYQLGDYAEFYPNEESLISCVKEAFCDIS